MRNRTSDLRIPRSDALPLSHRDCTVSVVYYDVHMSRVLHTARISNVDSVMLEIREVVSFELGKEIKRVGQNNYFFTVIIHHIFFAILS